MPRKNQVRLIRLVNFEVEIKKKHFQDCFLDLRKCSGFSGESVSSRIIVFLDEWVHVHLDVSFVTKGDNICYLVLCFSL